MSKDDKNTTDACNGAAQCLAQGQPQPQAQGGNKEQPPTTNGSRVGSGGFEFIIPPEAPVFSPTEAEFQEPLVYIDKIRPIAEKFGICKIKPPANWQPPFTVDVDKLKFTPRIQRLNELEAKTRIKLNFLDQIAKFWELQGSSLKIPMVEKRALDLYTLHRLVENEGGFVHATNGRKWAKIAVHMGYPYGKGTGTILKTHYERLLYPYELFINEKKNPGEIFEIIKEPKDDDYRPPVKVDVPTGSPKKNGVMRRSLKSAEKPKDGKKAKSNGDVEIKQDSSDDKEMDEKDSKRDNKENKEKDKDVKEDIKELNGTKLRSPIKDESGEVGSKELKRLQFFGAGPKMAGFNVRKKADDKTRGKVIDYQFDCDPLAKYICQNCKRGDAEEQMLLCDGCDDSYHTFCLMPPLAEIPKGDWCCPRCIAAEVSKPTEAFGFEQAHREYNLQQFGEMADTFKSEYFNMPVHLVSTSMVEKEFWRIVSSIDEDVTVEYGADLHTMDHGSGFPTKNSINLQPGDQEYACSGWNLNNLPVLEGSVLGYINADISGMKVPWMYVGMCFATFCWHNEDHWSYSINYLHWGEPKTWYGVSGMQAELFEKTMKSAAPELFHTQPDLLHQLVTIMNPNILMNAGVKVFRTDQHAGEFVITFPRAYHAGFNQGYNFAEAVNFAPADWIAMGRECVMHYSQLRRFCVFSHDELVCKMATNSDKLDITVAAATYTDMLRMVETEKKLRKSLLDWGVTNAEREAFELLPDDERQCEICKTTCFMSALTCGCTKDIVCLRHYSSLCKCAPNKHTLRYRYTLDELLPLLRSLKQKAESFDRWADGVKKVLDRKHPKSVTLNELRALAAEAEGKSFPKSDLMQTLANAIEDAEKCASVIRQLDLKKVRTRNSYDQKNKLTLEELRLFYEEIDSLACILDEEKIIKDLLDRTNNFEKEAERLLQVALSDCKLKEVEETINSSNDLCIELPTLKALSDRHSQLKWVKEVFDARKKSGDIADIETLQTLLRKGIVLPNDSLIESMLSDIQGVITQAQDWEAKAQALFKKTGPDVLSEAENLIKAAGKIDVYLPTENHLVDSVNNVKDWYKLLKEMNSLEFYPYLSSIEDLIKKSKSFPFQLEEVDRLKGYVKGATEWKEKTSKTFLRKTATTTLMDALSPRSQIAPAKGRKRNTEDVFKITENMDQASLVAAFKDAEDREMKFIETTRLANQAKVLTKESESTFCVCLKPASGLMMKCELCNDWFHSGCVPLPKVSGRRLRKNLKASGIHIGFKDCKFLCTNCNRTRRPRLETILCLLMALQKLLTRIPEGDALQCLTERAMNWQDRARNLLSHPDVAAATAKIQTMTQKYNDSKSKHDKNGDVKKSDKDASLVSMSSEDESQSAISSISSDDEDCKEEHAYSMHSKLAENDFCVQLKEGTKELLADLLMEGDMLEVSLEENVQLFQVAFMARDYVKNPNIIDFDVATKTQTPRKGRKRRSETEEPAKKKELTAVKKPKKRNQKEPGGNGVKAAASATRKRKGRARNSQSSSDEEADEDAMCAVAKCLKPVGDEVDWVQCDGGCEQWFHMACVGLSAKDINEDEDYYCSACSPPETVKEQLKLANSASELVIEY